jgi:hypothetical protein
MEGGGGKRMLGERRQLPTGLLVRYHSPACENETYRRRPPHFVSSKGQGGDRCLCEEEEGGVV